MFVELKDITTKITKGTTPSTIGASFVEKGINYIRSECITSIRKLDFSKYCFIDDVTHEKLKRSQIEENDILFSMAGMFLGKTAIVNLNDLPANTNQAVAIIRIDRKLADYRYVYYFLNQKHIIEQINSLSAQSAQPNINLKEIGSLKISMPSLNVQQSIADFLSVVDDKIELNTQINDNLQQQAQAIFTQEILALDKFPDDWRKGSLLDIADYLNGLAMQKFRPKDNEVGLPVLKIKELRQGICDDSSEFCSPNIKPYYIIHDGDVIFSWSGSLLVDFWCGGISGLNQHLFKVSSQQYDKWFYYAWTNHHLQKFISIAADKATTMGHIKREELAKSEVWIPSNEDYNRIGNMLRPIYDLIITNRLENRKLASIRDELLPKLMSGEINVEEVSI